MNDDIYEKTWTGRVSTKAIRERDEALAKVERLQREVNLLREQSLRVHRLVCKTHTPTPTLGDTECPLCGRFIPDLALGAALDGGDRT